MDEKSLAFFKDREYTGRQRFMGNDSNQKSFSDALVEAAVDAIITIDSKGIVKTFNPAAESIFGYSADDVIGNNVNMLMPDPHRTKHDDYIKRYLDTGKAKIIGIGRNTFGQHKDGSFFPIHLAVNEFQANGERMFVGMLQDVTEREHARRRLTAQYETSKALAEADTLETASNEFIRAVCEEMNWALGSVWVVDRKEILLRCVGGWHRSADLDNFEARTREITFKYDEGFPGRAWAEGEPVWSEDVVLESGYLRARLADKIGLRGAFFFPCKSQGEVVGVIELHSDRPEQLDEDLIKVMDASGNQLAQFIERKHSEKEADRVKSEFFALISHELRTPLTSIVGYLELISRDRGEQDKLTDDQRQFLSVIGQSTTRLQRLVGDLLFVAQIETGSFVLEPNTVNLSTLVTESVKKAQPGAAKTGVDLQYRCEPVPDIEGDADRLGQMFDNLISNALKFTPADGEVNVKVSSKDPNVSISVADTGPGILEADKERLFDRFFRASFAVEKSVPGVGLGLSIVKAIAEGHGGHVTVESEVGEGTTFTVELPISTQVWDDQVVQAE